MTLPDELRNEVPSKLSVQGVSKRFRTGVNKVQALDNVSLEVGEGEFVCLVGPSGCGKTTLLNIIGGLEQADSGQVLADGMPVPEGAASGAVADGARIFAALVT